MMAWSGGKKAGAISPSEQFRARGCFVVETRPNGYKPPMVSKAQCIILADRARLPWRFFGRLASCAQAAL
jgi:hypothetical protein